MLKIIKICLFLCLIILANCNTTGQLIKSADKQDNKIEETRTENEINKTKDLIEWINHLDISDFDKKWIIKQIQQKDFQLKLKDAKLNEYYTRIEAHRIDSTQRINKAEKKEETCIQEQKDCLIDAGYGRSFKMIFYGLIGLAILFIIYYAMKTGLWGIIRGNK